MKHRHNPKPFVGCAVCDIEKNEQKFKELCTDLQRDCYEELFEIIAPDGQVHYRRPKNHPDINEAKKTNGYKIRRMK